MNCRILSDNQNTTCEENGLPDDPSTWFIQRLYTLVQHAGIHELELLYTLAKEVVKY